MREKSPIPIFFKSVLGFLFTEPNDLSEQKWLKEDNFYESMGVVEKTGDLILGKVKDNISTMTSDTTPSPLVASASSSDLRFGAPFKAFNKTAIDSSDGWNALEGAALPQWLQIDLGEENEKHIGAYQIQCRNLDNWWFFPKTWSILGSNNGTDWNVLDEREDIPNPGQAQWTSVFSLSNSGLYRYYRIHVTEVHPVSGYHYLYIAQLVFYEFSDSGDILLESGHRISNPQSLNSIKSVKSSNINWESEGEDIKIYTQVNEDDTTPTGVFPDNWEEATNDSSITDITGNLTGKFLWIKQDFNDYTKLLCHFDNNFDDESSSSHVPTNTGVTFSDTYKQFGTHSAHFDSSKLLFDDDDDFAMGTSAFTVDFRARITGNTGNNGCIAHFANRYINSTGFLIMWRPASSTFALYQNNDFRITGPTCSLNTFYHVALVGNGEADGSRNIKLYIDGIQAGSTYTINYNFTDVVLLLGTLFLTFKSGHTDYIKGYIDEFRISKGIARWTSNFTPPTSAYFGYPSLSQLKVQID